MPIHIRPVRREDYQALAMAIRLGMPGTDDTAESLLEDDEQTHAHQRWLAEADGQVVGTASWFQLRSHLHPRKFRMDGAVLPEFRRQGIGAALLDAVLMTLSAQNAISVRTFAREDYVHTFRFLERRGFEAVMRSWESFLDLKAFSFESFAGQAEASD